MKIDNSSHLRHWEYNPLFFLSYLGFGLIGSDIWHISCSWYNISLQLGHSKQSKQNKTNKTKKGLTKPQRESIFPPFSTFHRQQGTWNTFWCFPDTIKNVFSYWSLNFIGINMFFSSWSQQVNFALVVYSYPLGNVNFLSAKWFKTKLNMWEEQKKRFTFVSVVLLVGIFWLQITTPPPFSCHKSVQLSVNWEAVQEFDGPLTVSVPCQNSPLNWGLEVRDREDNTLQKC